MSETQKPFKICEAVIHAEKVAAHLRLHPGRDLHGEKVVNGRTALIRQSAELYTTPASPQLRWLARMMVTRIPWGDRLFAAAEEEAERSRQLAYNAGKALLVIASASSSESEQHVAGKRTHLFRTDSSTVFCDLSGASVSATIHGTKYNLETNQTRGIGQAAPNPAEITFTDCTITDPRKQQFLLSSVPPTPAIEFSRDLKAALDHAQRELQPSVDGRAEP